MRLSEEQLSFNELIHIKRTNISHKSSELVIKAADAFYGSFGYKCHNPEETWGNREYSKDGSRELPILLLTLSIDPGEIRATVLPL